MKKILNLFKLCCSKDESEAIEHEDGKKIQEVEISASNDYVPITQPIIPINPVISLPEVLKTEQKANTKPVKKKNMTKNRKSEEIIDKSKKKVMKSLSVDPIVPNSPLILPEKKVLKGILKKPKT